MYHIFQSSEYKFIPIYATFYRWKLYCGRESWILIIDKKRLFPTIVLFRRRRRDTFKNRRNEQDRQCTYNVTISRVRATIVAMEKQRVLHNLSVCICSLKHPACNVRAPYCHLWPAPLYNIFPHYVTNGTDFEKKFLNIKRVFWFFSTTFLSETFLILWRNERDMIKECMLTFM
jgi:hypothetical protein